MSRDLIIGILLSAAIHLGILFGEKINPAWFKPAPKKAEAEPEKGATFYFTLEGGGADG